MIRRVMLSATAFVALICPSWSAPFVFDLQKANHPIALRVEVPEAWRVTQHPLVFGPKRGEAHVLTFELEENALPRGAFSIHLFGRGEPFLPWAVATLNQSALEVISVDNEASWLEATGTINGQPVYVRFVDVGHGVGYFSQFRFANDAQRSRYGNAIGSFLDSIQPLLIVDP